MSSNHASSGDERRSSTVPRAIIHKQILDAAAADPTAAMADLAAEVTGATTDLVEQVLSEYGDPAADAVESDGPGVDGGDGDDSGAAPRDETETTSPDDPPTANRTEPTAADGETAVHSTSVDEDGSTVDDEETPVSHDRDDEASSEAETDGDDRESTRESADGGRDRAQDAPTDPVDGPIDLSALTPTERETVRAIAERPEAPQRAIGERLGVTAATISQRVSGIEGFTWEDRADLVADLLDGDETSVTDGGSTAATDEDEDRHGPTEVTATDENQHGATEAADADENHEGATEAADAKDESTDEDGGESDETAGERAVDDDRVADGQPPGDDLVGRVDGLADRLDDVVDRLETLAGRLDDLEARSGDGSTPSPGDGDRERPVFDDPELAATVVRACVRSADVDETDEVRIVEALLLGGGDSR